MRRRAFTFVEFMVLFGIVVILLSIFVPYLLKLREDDRRLRCRANLNQIKRAMDLYAQANGHVYPRVIFDSERNPNGYTAFTGADDENPFAPGSTVRPNDVTASIWLLVRLGLADTQVFVCPSSGDSRDLVTDSAGRSVKPLQRGNFRNPRNLSYSYSSPFTTAPGYRIDDNRVSDFAVMADKSPGNSTPADRITAPAWDAPVLELSAANSRNHGKAGQNVLYADGSVRFEKSVYCGVAGTRGEPRSAASSAQRSAGDNIYTALATTPLPEPLPPANGNGYWGPDIGPAWWGDSYLVPTADDGHSVSPIGSASSTPTPATAPATTSVAPAVTGPPPGTAPATTNGAG